MADFVITREVNFDSAFLALLHRVCRRIQPIYQTELEVKDDFITAGEPFYYYISPKQTNLKETLRMIWQTGIYGEISFEKLYALGLALLIGVLLCCRLPGMSPKNSIVRINPPLSQNHLFIKIFDRSILEVVKEEINNDKYFNKATVEIALL